MTTNDDEAEGPGIGEKAMAELEADFERELDDYIAQWKSEVEKHHADNSQPATDKSFNPTAKAAMQAALESVESTDEAKAIIRSMYP